MPTSISTYWILLLLSLRADELPSTQCVGVTNSWKHTQDDHTCWMNKWGFWFAQTQNPISSLRLIKWKKKALCLRVHVCHIKWALSLIAHATFHLFSLWVLLIRCVTSTSYAGVFLSLLSAFIHPYQGEKVKRTIILSGTFGITFILKAKNIHQSEIWREGNNKRALLVKANRGFEDVAKEFKGPLCCLVNPLKHWIYLQRCKKIFKQKNVLLFVKIIYKAGLIRLNAVDNTPHNQSSMMMVYCPKFSMRKLKTKLQ